MKNKMISCKTCGSEIAKSAKTCPNCGAKNSKPIYKRVWFWALIVVVVFIFISILGSGDSSGVKDAKAMSEKDFIASCEKVSYKDLQRNPENYIDKGIKLDVKIEQIVDSSLIRAYSGSGSQNPENWYDDEYVISDSRESGEDFVEGDILTIYGIYLGTETVERAIGGSDDLPSIAVIYAKESETMAMINNLMKNVNFKLVEDSYGWKEYSAVVENTTEFTFDSFSYDVTLNCKDGTTETDTAYTNNWKPGEKHTFTIDTDKNVKSIKVDGYDYY